MLETTFNHKQCQPQFTVGSGCGSLFRIIDPGPAGQLITDTLDPAPQHCLCLWEARIWGLDDQQVRYPIWTLYRM
jgi:hypothetical protein